MGCEPVQIVMLPRVHIRQRRTVSSTSMSTPLRDFRWLISGIVVALWISPATAFQVSMSTGDAYKPPVKSSVEKMYDRRYGDTISSSSRSSNPARRRPRSSSDDRRTSSAKAAHAGTLSMPPARSFEQRMRDMVLGTPPPTSSRTVGPIQEQQRQQQQRALPPNVLTIETLQDYKRVVGDEREKLVAVRFYATYCKACQAVAPYFYKLARDFPDIIFVDVPVTDKNAALHQGLGVATLPFAHIYHPMTGLVEEHKLTRKDVESFREKLQGYVDGSNRASD